MESCLSLVNIDTCGSTNVTSAHTRRCITNSKSGHFFFFLHLRVQHFAHNLGSVEVTQPLCEMRLHFGCRALFLMLEDSVTGLHAACSTCRLQVNMARTVVPRATMNLPLTADRRRALQQRNTAESLPNAQNAAAFTVLQAPLKPLFLFFFHVKRRHTNRTCRK